MTVHEAKAIARRWVSEEGSETPGFHGAFFHGAVNTAPEEATLPASSDLDVMLVLTNDIPEHKLGKFLYQGILLEVSYLAWGQIASADAVLTHYHLANSLRTPGIIADPSGELSKLQAIVERDFAKEHWVRKRCEDAQHGVLRCLAPAEKPVPFQNRVMSWLFANGILTHILLVAGLKNPTVRKRYVAARELLAEYGHSNFHEALLELLGCAYLTAEQVRKHLAPLAEAFDTAAAALRTPYPFAADISAEGKPIAIGGSAELIETGLHREAIFWMVATYCRCLQVLAADASPEVQAQHLRGLQLLLADLGINSAADVQQRGEQVRQFLPQVQIVADAIIKANPAILKAD